MESEAPTVEHIVLIAGCGRDGRPGEFQCQPEDGYHFFSHGDQVKRFLEYSPKAASVCNYPASHVAFYKDKNWGEIKESACYTINPEAKCKPHFEGIFMDAKNAVGDHKFGLIHIDHATNVAETSSFDKLKASLHLAFDMLEDEGVLYWDIFNLVFDLKDGKWIGQKGNKLADEGWEKLKDEIHRLAGDRGYDLVNGLILGRGGSSKTPEDESAEGDTWTITGVLIWKRPAGQ